MMFELVNATQTYLYANNRPPPKSFYDQMVTNNQKQVDEKEKEAQELERKQLLEDELEVIMARHLQTDRLI